MRDKYKTKGLLIIELEEMRRRIAELEAAQDTYRQIEKRMIERERLNEGLTRINETIRNSLSTSEILQCLVSEGAATLGCETGAVSLRYGESWRVSHVHGFHESLIGTQRGDDEERHFVLALNTRDSVVIENTLNDERVNSEHMRRHNLRAAIVAPLIVRNKSLGIICFNYHSEPRSFTDAQLQFVAQLAVTAAIALENGRLFDDPAQPGKAPWVGAYSPHLSFPELAKDPWRSAGFEDTSLLGRRERILFVDDDEVLVEMSKQLLERLGYEVITTTGSREALSLFSTDPFRFDLVITDQTMPEMTGLELTRSILALRPDIPIILCTGFSHLADPKSIQQAGVKAFAMKPLAKNEMARTIRRVLDEYGKIMA